MQERRIKSETLDFLIGMHCIIEALSDFLETFEQQFVMPKTTDWCFEQYCSDVFLDLLPSKDAAVASISFRALYANKTSGSADKQ